MSKVLCFGELLLRLSPQLGGAWIKEASMPVFVGGAELNCATALAHWKIPVSYATALPDNYLSKEIEVAVAAKGIDTGRIIYRGERIGTYYLPQGADLKNAGVIYDRAFSSFWSLEPGMINWEKLLEGVSWFHFSAISPALNEKLAAVCKEGLQVASRKGITISVDLNYRAKLWQYGNEPVEIMPDLVKYCDVVMGNLWAAEKMLGIPLEDNLLSDQKTQYLEASEKLSRTIIQKFGKCTQVANTFRFDKGKGVQYYATLYKEDNLFVSMEHYTSEIIDKVGSGDTFMAGLIYGNYKNHSSQDIINFASAAAFNKLFIKGDASTATVEDIQKRILNYAG